MKLQYSTFICPHIGDRYSQCADRFAISKENHRFAIADGVGASFFPEVWAELVSQDFTNHSETFAEDTHLVREQQLISKWNEIVNEKIVNLTTEEQFIVEMSKERCDFAACTFVGLSIDDNKWHCHALGDSYLFVLNNKLEIISSIASQAGHAFDNFPEYLASVHGKNNGRIIYENGEISGVEYFVLLTDAISDWFLNADENERHSLINVQSMPDFQSLIDSKRASGKMKDDDTTAVIIKVVHDDSAEISIEEIYNTNINVLIKKEDEANQERTLQIEEAKKDDNLPDIVEMGTDNVSIKNLTNNNQEAVLIDKVKQFVQTTQETLKSIVRESKSIQGKNKKTLDKLERSIGKDMTKVLKVISKQLKKI